MVFSFDIVSIKEHTNLKRKKEESLRMNERSPSQLFELNRSRSCRYETEGKSVISILLPKRNCVFVRIIRSFFLLLLSSRQFHSMVYSLIIDYFSALFILRKNFLLLGTVLSFLDGKNFIAHE